MSIRDACLIACRGMVLPSLVLCILWVSRCLSEPGHTRPVLQPLWSHIRLRFMGWCWLLIPLQKCSYFLRYAKIVMLQYSALRWLLWFSHQLRYLQIFLLIDAAAGILFDPCHDHKPVWRPNRKSNLYNTFTFPIKEPKSISRIFAKFNSAWILWFSVKQLRKKHSKTVVEQAQATKRLFRAETKLDRDSQDSNYK